MKRIYYAAMTVVFTTMSFTGCSSDEVTVTEPDPVTTHSDDKQQKQDDEPNNNGNQSGNNGEVTVKTRDINLTDAQKQAVSRNNDFAFNFYRQLIQQSEIKGKNNITSPLSVTYAVGMLNSGAKGKTSEEMTSMLGFENGTASDINELCSKLIEGAPKVDEEVILKLADCIVTHLDIELTDQYQKDMADYYQAEVFCKDFSKKSTITFINDWCNQHTEGNIKEIIHELNPEQKVVLMNAIYFKAAWSNKFKKEDTKMDSFTKENGVSRYVQMMHRKDATEYTSNDDYATISLPYGKNGNWRMYVLLPNEGKSIDDVMCGINNTSWEENLAKMYGMTVDVKLPKFKIESEMDLNNVLKALGATTMFNKNADFSLMTKEATQLFVDLIKQKATIEVSEEGTEASAVTINMMVTCAGEGGGVAIPQFYANRPFIYLIQETSSGAIFFMGTYQGN